MLITTDDKHYKGIANEIRSINGKDDGYMPEEMPVVLSEISAELTSQSEIVQSIEDAMQGKCADGYNIGYTDGERAEYERFWDAYQQNGNRIKYRYAFAGTGWTEDTLKPMHPIKIVDTTTNSRGCLGMFYYLNNGGTKAFDMTEVCSKIDFSEALSIQGLFQNAYAKNITVDASKAINCTNAFSSGDNGNLNNIILTVSDACTNFSKTFDNAGQLTDLTITDGSQIAASIDLHWSPLTKKSIDSVIQALSTTTTGLTASFKKTAVEDAYTQD